MLVRKSITFRGVMEFAGHHLWWLTAWMFINVCLYHYADWNWMTIPWLPVSVVGTAVAFYVGFKNSQSYDRLWEARKIWGSVINSSRSWAVAVKSFSYHPDLSKEELHRIKKDLIYRHIAWIYTLRHQLLVPTQWEHISLHHGFGRFNRRRLERFGLGLFQEEVDAVRMDKYLPEAEQLAKHNYANLATQLLDIQSETLAELNRKDILTIRKQIELQEIIKEFFDHQGRAERIKKFPFPRQYGSMSFLFVCLFIFLLPLGMMGEFAKLGEWGVWLSIPFGILIGWMYVLMELIGDYSENPFEGLMNDIPMLSICRTIEIDLLQMLGEKDVPAPIAVKKSVLM